MPGRSTAELATACEGRRAPSAACGEAEVVGAGRGAAGARRGIVVVAQGRKRVVPQLPCVRLSLLMMDSWHRVGLVHLCSLADVVRGR